MPWKDQSGGNGKDSGSESSGPWGQPGKRPGGQNGGNSDGGRGPGAGAPDLEELLKSGRERFRRAAGGGGGRGRGGSGKMAVPPRNLLVLGALALVGFWLFSGIYQVENNEQAVVTTFGKYSGVQGAGLRWHVPWPVQDVTVVPVSQERSTEIGGTEERQTADGLMLTSDLNIVAIGIKVNWAIKQRGYEQGEMPDVAKYVLKIEKPEALVRAVAESTLREVVGANELDPVISDKRNDIAEEMKQEIQATLDLYDSGIEIIRLNLGHAGPTPQVKPAFDEVIDARSEAQETINKARGYANKVVPEARGQAQKMMLDAEAYAARVVAEARGKASRFNAIYSEYAKAPEVTRQRMYLETLEKVLSGTDKIILDQDGAGTVPYLNVNELTRRSEQ